MTRIRSLSGHGHGDTEAHPQFASDNCLNCGQQLLLVCPSKNEALSIGPGVVAFTSFVKNVKTQVFMKTAVIQIYSILNATGFEKDFENCALCVDCSLVFAQLFGLFQTFESRRKSEGVLDVAVSKGIQWASEFTRSTNESVPSPESEQTIQEDGFVSESEKLSDGPSDKESNCDDGEIKSDVNETADLITVQPITWPEEQAVVDRQRTHYVNDANSTLGNEDPLCHPSPENTNITEAGSAFEMDARAETSEFNPVPDSPQGHDDAANSTENSAQELRGPLRKSRRIQAQTRIETSINPSEVEIKEDTEESDYAPASSNSDSDDSDTDEDNDGPTIELSSSRRKRGRISESYCQKNVTFKCTDCPEEFHATATLAEHRKSVHNKSEMFKCNICLQTCRPGFHLTANNEERAPKPKKSATKTSEEDNIFKCIDCGVRYSSPTDLGRHRISLHGAVKNPYVCHICLYSCKNAGHLKPHIIRHIGTEEHKCSKCPKVYKSYMSLRLHMRRKHKITLRKVHNLPLGDPSETLIIKCKKCGAGFESQGNFLEHSRTEHGYELFPCEICQKTFFKKYLLNAHIKSHAKPKVKCRLCNKRFHTAEGRSKHVKQAHQENGAELRRSFSNLANQDPESFQCIECPLAFETETELAAHVRCRHKVHEFKCDACEKSYVTKIKLRFHQRQMHGQLKCLTCHEIIKQGQMAAHLNQAHRRPKARPAVAIRPLQRQEDDIPYPCIDCPEISSTLKQFRTHRLTHSVSAKAIYKCPFCHKDKPPGRFRHHLEKHSESTDWPCAHCSMRFLMRRHRNAHQTQVHGPQPNDDPEGMLPLPPATTLQLISGESIHSDEERMEGRRYDMIFKCLDCDLEFKVARMLGNHRAVVHGCAVEHRFQCHYCLQFKPTAANLYQHARRHYAVERDNLCELCGKGFKLPDELKRHYKRIHAEDPKGRERRMKQVKEGWKRWRMRKAAAKNAEEDSQE